MTSLSTSGGTTVIPKRTPSVRRLVDGDSGRGCTSTGRLLAARHVVKPTRACLDFHHVRGEKEMAVDKMVVYGYCAADIHGEIEKCEVL